MTTKYKYASISLILMIALGLHLPVLAQKIGINGGLYPNGLRGSHFGSRIELPIKGNFKLALNYQMVKYTDIFALSSFIGEGLHKEYEQDETIIQFDELDRGFPIQNMSLDFRPKSLNHSFAFLLGYSIFDNHHFNLSMGFGPHLSFGRVYYHSYSVNPATIQFTENSQPIELPYFDYEIYRHWDWGPTVRLDFEYKLFENVSIGAMSIIYMDVIAEGIDLSVGFSLNYNFSK